MSDIVKQLLLRSGDEDGIGWTPTTVVHVPAGLLHEAADTIERLRAALERIVAEYPANRDCHQYARAALTEEPRT